MGLVDMTNNMMAPAVFSPCRKYRYRLARSWSLEVERLVLRFIRGEHTKNKLDDLVRFFSVIDGKPEPDHRHAISSALGYWSNAKEIEHEYMHIRTFKNGNGHLTFKRLDLVEKLNAVLAKHYPGALPHDRHAA